MFQSTHPYGVRHHFSKVVTKVPCFNPRTRTGCDSAYPTAPVPIPVSIHAPVRGATFAVPRNKFAFCVSIHAPVRGATRLVHLQPPNCWFQSTHPYGVRLSSAHQGLEKLKFQSTHPYGVRPAYAIYIRFLDIVSIHAPVRGATQGGGVTKEG